MLTWLAPVLIMTVVALAVAAMLADMKRRYLDASHDIPRLISQADVDARIAELERQFEA